MAFSLLVVSLCLLVFLPCTQASRTHSRYEAEAQKCSQVLVRKEWRTLTDIEKTDWVRSVKVNVLRDLAVTAEALMIIMDSAWQAYNTNGYPSRKTRQYSTAKEACTMTFLTHTQLWSTVHTVMLTFYLGVRASTLFAQRRLTEVQIAGSPTYSTPPSAEPVDTKGQLCTGTGHRIM